MIPLVDLRAQYESLKQEIDSAIASVLADCQFSKGPHVERLEKEWGLIGVGSCTDALYLTLRALRIGAGDEVIVPAMTFIATAEAVTMAGATPVFVDIDPMSYCIDPTAIADAITERTAAIIPVHLYGRLADLDAICEIASKNGLEVIEDCAQYSDFRSAWPYTKAQCFSFYPSKNLGAYGDGGAVRTGDWDLRERIRTIADHGQREKNIHDYAGVCSRLDDLQAAIVTAKIPHLEEWNAGRHITALALGVNLMDEKKIGLPDIPPGRKEHLLHLFVVRVQERDKVRKIMAEKGIEAGVHYPVIVPELRPYKHLKYSKWDFPNAFALSQECLSLPIYPELTLEQIRHIAKSLIEAVNA